MAGCTMHSHLEAECASAASDSSLSAAQLAAGDPGALWACLAGPVDAAAAALDAVHALTGAPWWVVLAASTVAIRAALVPLVLKSATVGACFGRLGPQLPPPLPTLGSGVGVREQLRLFERRRKELGAPSALWLVVPPLAPTLLLWAALVRHMALQCRDGFATGGALWFVDLTAQPQGALGFILPTFIAVSYFTNVQVSFQGAELKQGPLANLSLLFKWFLEFLTLPAFLAAVSLPQAVHMGWLANNLFTFCQIKVMRLATIRQALGHEKADKHHMNEPKADKLIVAAEMDKRNAAPQLALGQLHARQQRWPEAAAFYASAMAKARTDDVKVEALFGNGLALYNQGKEVEAVRCLGSTVHIAPDSTHSKRRRAQAMAALARYILS
eukprot:SM000013S26385  [mRNA]  locus=s13:96603:100599:+ [translate_table: standard]